MLDLLTNAPREVAFGPRTLKVGALKLREIGQLQRWIRDHAVRPTIRLKDEIELYPEEDRRAARLAAIQAERFWPPDVNSAEGNNILFDDIDGQVYFLGVMLRKFQPDMTDADLDEITAGLSEVDLTMLIRIAFGEDDLDPKAVREEILANMASARQKLKVNQGGAEAPTGESSSTDSGPSLPT